MVRKLGATIAVLVFAVNVAAWAAPARPTAVAGPKTTTDLSSPTILDPDDDNVATELTYHWQDPFYSRDERLQMAYILVFLCAAGVGVGARRFMRLRRYAESGEQKRVRP